MSNLSVEEIGSVLLNMIENVPSYLSGATLHNMIKQEINFAENFTGLNIGTSVSDVYQPAIISLSASSILRMMEMQGVDVSSFKLGDLSVSKGGQSSSLSTSDKLREDALMKLNYMGQSISHYKAVG